MEKEIDALKTASDYIDNIKSAIENLVNKINSGEEYNAMNIIAKVADGIEWFANIISSTNNFHKGSISIKEINEQLVEIIEALENEDYVLVGDLFSYEFLPILENVQEDIKKVICA